MGSVDDTASRMQSGARAERPLGDAYLLVFENETSRTFRLPRDGSIIIGRASEADLTLDHASVSRRHATIGITGGALRVADLGSHNKTRVNGVKIDETRTLSSGDVIAIGDVTLVLHVSNPEVASHTPKPPTAWRRRLAEEIERAITFHRSFAVLALLGVQADTVAGLQALRLIDVVGVGPDGAAFVLFPETDREQARRSARLVLGALLEVPGSERVVGGLALCPSDACDVDSLLLAASNAARQVPKTAVSGTLAEAAEAPSQISLGERSVTVLDPAMHRVYQLLERLAPATLPVLILGENGVGKENAAFAVHYHSKRTGPFIARNCAAFSEGTAESELFGHDKGAFTGAVTAKPGLFEAAQGGTVFLDEIADLPIALQVKLLRVLQEKKITRMGETRERDVDFRLVCATWKSLDEEVVTGRFRQDLLFRLAGAKVMLPPLRDRRCEIPLLARRFLEEACTTNGFAPKQITPEAMQLLLTCDWPGNVRQLKQAIDRAAVLALDDRIEPIDLGPEFSEPVAPPPPIAPPPASETAATGTTFRPIKDEIEELEKRRMTEAYAAANKVKTQAAALIGMPIRTFTLKFTQYKLAT